MSEVKLKPCSNPEWVSVEDALPKEKEEVWVVDYYKNKPFSTLAYLCDGEWFSCFEDCNGSLNVGDVKLWMEYIPPSPPKEKS